MGDEQTAAEFWEARYADTDQVWSGRVNPVLAAIVAELPPGRALDLGCGEGGDAVWLAEHGWTAVGVDLSPTAVERGRREARARGLSEEVTLVAADLEAWLADAADRTASTGAAAEPGFDLAAASFLQSWPVEIPREAILRQATGVVAPGGRLLVVAHAAPPPWADPALVADRPFPQPEQDRDALGLDPDQWRILVCERRQRAVTAPDGSPATLLDSVLLVQRRS
ncbi:MAG: class I SAM-dependent methyltransferase [Propioniciclava sp.]